MLPNVSLTCQLTTLKDCFPEQACHNRYVFEMILQIKQKEKLYFLRKHKTTYLTYRFSLVSLLDVTC